MTVPGSTDKRGLEGGLPLKEPKGAEDMGQGLQPPRGHRHL